MHLPGKESTLTRPHGVCCTIPLNYQGVEYRYHTISMLLLRRKDPKATALLARWESRDVLISCMVLVPVCKYPRQNSLATVAVDLGILMATLKVQILSHQSKIATQIELFVGHGDTYESAQFRRLGYLSLNSNERSKYQARELKSVYVNAPGQYMRMVIHKCYINEINLFNQVGCLCWRRSDSSVTPLRNDYQHPPQDRTTMRLRRCAPRCPCKDVEICHRSSCGQCITKKRVEHAKNNTVSALFLCM